MKVKVIKEFKEGKNVFQIGEEYPTYQDSIIVNQLWICDVDSPFFKEHFKLLKLEKAGK